MKILLICSGGMSTHILMQSLEKEAKKMEIANYSADAIGAYELDDYQKDFDVILVAPQIRFKFDTYEKHAKNHNKLVYQIQPMEYNPIGAPKLLQNVLKLMEEK